ncbi:MAG TPA: sulfite exporter TauE/SafE family protein, partial [Gemmataceae bacterium]|nr:sulfite exporter TauE/SafE family protein [Gemmataceae bacterium]
SGSGPRRFRGWVGWVAGAVSGFLGGLVGNQGGIRSVAMLGFDVPRHAFVATATAVGLIVDGARLPVYLATQGKEIADRWPLLVAATTGAVVGTLAGERLLRRIPEPVYRRLVVGAGPWSLGRQDRPGQQGTGRPVAGTPRSPRSWPTSA